MLHNQSILIGTYYKHPTKNSDNTFLNKLKTTLKKTTTNKHIIISGDFNYVSLKHKYNENVSEFLNMLYYNFPKPCIREPPRIIKGNGPTLVDIILINLDNNKCSSGNLYEEITDHLPNLLMIENVCSNKRKENNKTRNLKIFDQVKYQEDLKELENETLTFSNVNETFNKFQTELIKIIHKHGSYITLS